MAAQTISAKVDLRLTLAETLAYGLETKVESTQLFPLFNYVNGVGSTALAINQSFTKSATAITLAAGASTTLTLTTLTDDLGRSLSMAGGVRLVAIYVTNRTAGDFLTVGAAAANPWISFLGGTTPTVKVYDLFVISVGSTDKYAVAAGSNEQLKFTNSGSNSMTFKVVVLGCLT